MIVRLLGEGQFSLDDSRLDELNALDEKLEAALATDGEDFQAVLAEMADLVRTEGTPEPDEFLGASDIAIPSEDASREEVVGMLAEDGLIPG